MSKSDFKSEVKQYAKNADFEYLLILKNEKSKLDNKIYDDFHLQPYLQSPQLPADQASLLLALRTRTVRGIRSHFGDMYGSKLCPLPECGEQDSLPHLQSCKVLHDLVRVEKEQARYEEVFSGDLNKQWQAADFFRRLLEAREMIEEAAKEEEEEEDDDVSADQMP